MCVHACVCVSTGNWWSPTVMHLLAPVSLVRASLPDPSVPFVVVHFPLFSPSLGVKTDNSLASQVFYVHINYGHSLSALSWWFQGLRTPSYIFCEQSCLFRGRFFAQDHICAQWQADGEGQGTESWVSGLDSCDSARPPWFLLILDHSLRFLARELCKMQISVYFPLDPPLAPIAFYTELRVF